MKTINKDKDVAALGSKQSEQLHKEFRRGVSKNGLDALDQIFALAQADPLRFHDLWIQPLANASLSFEAIIALIVDSHLWPN
jgi:hypothetical protein